MPELENGCLLYEDDDEHNYSLLLSIDTVFYTYNILHFHLVSNHILYYFSGQEAKMGLLNVAPTQEAQK